MTQDQIESAVERKFDVLDAQFLMPAFRRASGEAMTLAEYEAASAKITAWAEAEYRRLTATR